MLGLISQCTLTASVLHGMGNSADHLETSDLEKAALLGLVSITLLLFALTPAKIAIIALILRIQGATHRKRSYLLHFLAYSNVSP